MSQLSARNKLQPAVHGVCLYTGTSQTVALDTRANRHLDHLRHSTLQAIMGSFHGRRKPASKKPSKAKGDTAEEIAAREARDQFIKDMAAKALPPPADVDVGGIHPSRLARTTGGAPEPNFSQGRQADRPARGQRAPDLRKPNKRTFEDDDQGQNGPGQAKKQRTLQEIRKLKGPAAMKKEEEKRRRQADEELAAAQAKKEALEKKEAGPQSDDEDTPIPSKKGKKNITNGESAKSVEEKAARKAAKAARKAAKNGAAIVATDAETEKSPVSDTAKETKEERKARRRAEKATKAAATSEPSEIAATTAARKPSSVVTEETETKEAKKERKRLAKLANKAVAE